MIDVDDNYVVVVWRQRGHGENEISTFLDASGNVLAHKLDSPETSGTRYLSNFEQVKAVLNHHATRLSVPISIAKQLNPEWRYTPVE